MFVRPDRHGLIILLLGLTSLFTSGCVSRQLLIRTNPEGALVTIDAQTVGNSPVQVPFTYYGTREIKLEKEGYETVKVKQNIRPPWWQIPPLDFLTDNFALRKLRDQRILEFDMQPAQMTDENLLIHRASDLRNNTQRGTLPMPLAERDSPAENRR
ncbi:MAG TPA: PEGA domain-containing protein [Pirellulaceae bacterium]|nr:PEGA domain-containing protein [Pirellulaceae bacterium]HMO92861.1 PEGA domain-containing protein [Pirellulaceae bacterium]HMP69397.1 PEGA domain-containing protein [Pirellulaceae bacterium]